MERLEIDGAGEALLARPQGEGPFPAVLLAHGEDGPGGLARAWAQRLAAEGMLVLLPHLHQDPLATATARETLTGRPALARLEASLRHLAAHGDADRDRLAVLGIGAGGTLAFLLACTTRVRLAAAADVGGALVHGRLCAERPIQPLELALNLACPLLVLLTEGDEHAPPGHAQEVERRLAQFAREAEVAVIPRSAGGFLEITGSGYDGASLQEAWTRTLAFLRAHLT